jgi:hypothetical protein
MIKKITYILTLIFLYSCGSLKELKKEKRILIIQSSGKSFSNPDIFVTYLNIEKRPINKKMQCDVYADSIVKKLKETLKSNNIENYKIEKGRLKQNQAFSLVKGEPDKFLGNYCQSSLALSLYKEKESNKIYSLLLNKFNVAEQKYYSTKMDSLNLIAYENAIKNADLLSNHLIKKLGLKSKKLIRITNINESSKSNDLLHKVNDYPSWIFGSSFLQAINFLKENLIIVNKEITVEYEIE